MYNIQNIDIDQLLLQGKFREVLDLIKSIINV